MVAKAGDGVGGWDQQRQTTIYSTGKQPGPRASPVAVGKNPPASAGDMGSISNPERSLQKEMATHSSILV